MILAPVSLLRALALLAIIVGWAVLAHQGSAGDAHRDFAAAVATAPIIVIAVMLLWRAGHPLWIIGGGTAVFLLLAWAWPLLRQNVALLYYVQHVGTNLALATFFGRTLFDGHEALVSQFARFAHAGVISPLKARYTRQVTVAWTTFFLTTATVSTLLFWLAPAAAWSVFANLLTMPLIIMMFAGEHLVRQRALPAAERSSIADTIRGYRTAMQARNQAAPRNP
ncbi:MAG: hypothetical protein CVU34_03770 [Betaproteobacteria bacterium HGW-Betaproteobacteria-7]|jgi:uncharacterized membrane protein|nr:MAG: hypothetical protein CVU34_03770 [Betaproteobacteria bacterium HGW-Betaproteobacteria-7]